MKKILLLVLCAAPLAGAADDSKSVTSLPNMMVTAMPTEDRVEVAAEYGTGEEDYWRIRDISGMTNIRNAPKGEVCMKLKAHTRYRIYVDGSSNGWLRISAIYNESDRYWVNLHSSSTGTYWIAKSILY